MRTKAPIFAGLLSLAAKAGRADPTWPAPTDQMEEIIYQLQGVGGSLFNDIITPCDNEAAGPGRVTASEWLRVGFHDMSTHNRFSGTGGVDGSLQFELTNGENTGPGHNTTLQFYAHYLTSRSSMADLIAAGVYASVRSCGGPVIPLRLGRRDATEAGASGVPQPQNSVGTFRSQFDRMGFSQTEMIQLVACGHSLGSVHSAEFPQIVPASVGQIGFDSTNTQFDNKVVTEYVSGNTTNPLVVGAAIAVNRHSDFKVFNSDGNATINTMTSPAAYNDICQTVLQKMIDVVPAGVTLTDPIAPYAVKPVDIQLTLNTGGTTFLLTGSIRVRTTELPASSISNVVLTWKDRNGGNSCGSSASCSVTATLQGVSTGFDDTFGFFPIEATIPASSGISSFTLTVNLNDGSSQTYDNNGNSYPMSDAVVLQKPQSCLLQGPGSLTVSALVRNDIVDLPVNLGVSYLTPRNTPDGNPVPALNEATIPMTQGDCVGQYTFYTASYTIPGGLSFNARISVTAGDGSGAYTDDFNKASDLSGACSTFTGGATCSDVTPPATSTTVSSTTSVSATSTSSTGTPTPTVKPIVGGYEFVSCWTEGTGARALSGAAFAYDEMTLESCMTNCTGFDYWGTEYGRECYCGNSLHSSSTEAPIEECNMACGGDPTEFCGAGNRIELYSTTATRTTSATPTPTGSLAVKPTVGDYVFVGCQTEATAGRALSGNTYADDSMTLESCAAFCNGFTYFGTEYGRECYCGDNINAGSVSAPVEECNMVCAGDPYEYCGAGNRLELYRLASVSSTTGPSSEATTTTATPSPTGTLARQPTVSPYIFAGCWTEGTGARALSADTYASANNMTLENCAAFCDGYRYFGTEYAGECFCGNTIHPTSTEASLEDCSMACTGNPYQYCGGANRLELYETDDVTAPAGPSQPVTVGTWTFYGCMTEATAARALGSDSFAADILTLEDCAEFCAGYQYFGAEFGRECYCGNSFGTGSAEAPAGDCTMTCAGDSSQFCGAGNRLSVYEAA
ncbi:putative fungistatic metabolite [Madurella mycetomatis]|uniref:Putative fungistatic metabolite n=1 Tax=Madurella mycetomatis TaxID=100816 RepID=A0A175VTM0_9PEZI|nr:putative fungistatic metabolite [Madurella mycetomatis]KXX80919.1 putative fungistatic metabolite [Madurella mycetomatis]